MTTPKSSGSILSPGRRTTLVSDGLTYNSSNQKADILNEQFTSVLTKEDLSNQPQLPNRNVLSVSPIYVTVLGVLKLLQDLQTHKAAGPDKVPKRLELGTEEIALGMTKLYQLSIDQGKLPTDWQMSSLFFDDNISSPANCRPISLTSVFFKTLERVIHSNNYNVPF